MAKHISAVVGNAVLLDSDEPQYVLVSIDKGSIRNVIPINSESSTPENTLRIPDHCVILPGLIDCHVHLNQPGRTDWEGFLTGSTAAISGGVTTIIDMPLNAIPPTTTLKNLIIKQDEARTTGSYADLGFWGGIIPGNAEELKPLLDAGVKGFKCFLIDSGVDEFPHVDESDLHIACNALAGTNALVLFHAELEEPVQPPQSHQDPKQYTTFLRSRPPSLELSALQLILKLARRYPTLRFHIVHLSAASALPIIRQARQEGTRNLTVETCFHYLCLASEAISPCQTQYKCCPPIRNEENRRLLMEAVIDGTIDFVVSDHSPCVPELKKGDFMSAWGGVSGLGLGLSLLWTEMGKRLGLGHIGRLLSTRQADQVGLSGRKGAIAPGYEADLVIFDPTASFEVTQDTLRFKNKISPYIGMKLTGRVLQTYLRGALVWDSAGQIIDGPEGILL